MGRPAARQLRGWNFNTVGAWSAPQLYGKGIVYAPVIDMAASVQRDLWLKGGVVDYFSPQFLDAADRVAARMCAPHAEDPWLLGYFTDNELRWGKDWRSQDSLLESYLKMPKAPAGGQATAFVKALGHEPTEQDRGRKIPGPGGRGVCARRQPGDSPARPHHMVLGCRFAGYPGDAVIRPSADISM